MIMRKSLKILRGATLLAASVLLASACSDSGTDDRADLQDESETPTLATDQSSMSQDADIGAEDPDMDEGFAASDSMSGSMSDSDSDSMYDSGSDSMDRDSMGSMSGSMSGSSEGADSVSVDADGVLQVEIGATDAMQYTLEQFEVEAGQTVELTLTHLGRLGVEVMGHNVVILQSGNDPVEFGARVMEEGGAADNEYLPDALRGDVVASTDMIGGGETTTITFTAPDEPGLYAFVCTFPGHYAAMNGVMTVI